MSIHDPSIFHGYDVRGIYPTQMTTDLAYELGQAFVAVMEAKNVVVGRDVRPSGAMLQQAMMEGIVDAGATAIDVGVISTEMLYFAAATLDCEGGMSITASHNPAEWNGVKFIGKNAVAIVKSDKLGEIYNFVMGGRKLGQFNKGAIVQKDIQADYVEYLKKFSPANLSSLKLVANTNFGANGQIVDAVTSSLPLEIVRLNWERDGSFPKGTPDPLLPSNRKEISERILAEKAHFGVAWDADADRCFFYDDEGRFFHGYYITALLIEHFLKKEPGQPIVVENRLTWANEDAIKNGNGKLVLSKTGHGNIKKAMRDNNALFGGEISGHYYYRDFFHCDNGLITFLQVLDIFNHEIAEGRSVSALLDSYMEKYPINPQEMNYLTEEKDEIINQAKSRYADGEQNLTNGLAVEYPTWRFNLRKSDNEPILRLNIEARSPEELEKRKTELADFIGEFEAQLRNDSE